MFPSASSTCLRDVAMFIRMWPPPPLPYALPGFMCTPARSTKKRCIIISGVRAGSLAFFARLCSSASLLAPMRSIRSLTSSQHRYVASAFDSLTPGILSWLPP